MSGPEPAAAGPLRVRLHTLGCRLNEAETEAWARALHAQGAALVAAEAPADLVIVNTCAVTAEAVRKSRALLRRARRLSPTARLVVTGCAVSLPTPTLPDQDLDLIIPNRDKDQLVALATAALGLPLVTAPARDAAALFARGRQRAFVKVQDGCRHQCTFCVTTLARGPERSRPLANIVAEVNRLAGAGVAEVVLAGVHLAGYRDGADGLADLLGALLADTAMPRIRIGSLEPWDLPADFWARFANPRLLPHLHLPLQSGSDDVLRRMARRCKRADFLALVAEGRARVPGLNVTTDIIVGFPGETDGDWAATLEVLDQAAVGDVHGFGFSARPGTAAFALPDPVPATVRQARLAQLSALTRRLWQATLTAAVGRVAPVLLEGGDGPAPPPGPAGFGYTPDFLPVRATGLPGALDSRIQPLQLLGLSADGDALIGAFRDRSQPRLAD